MSNNTTTQLQQTLLSQQQLEELIERYFEGHTTPAEEAELRWQLVNTTHRSAAIDEAAAVMAFFATAAHLERIHQKQRKRTQRRLLATAATVALILAAGTVAGVYATRSEGQCYAYVNGKMVDSVNVVLNLIDMQTEPFSRLPLASDRNPVATQLSTVREALENDH